MAQPRTVGAVKRVEKKIAPSGKGKEKIGDAIAASSLKFFAQNGKQPVEANELVITLRKEGLPLPKEDHPARVMVATALRRRSDLFKKIKGEMARDPFKWVAA